LLAAEPGYYPIVQVPLNQPPKYTLPPLSGKPVTLDAINQARGTIEDAEEKVRIEGLKRAAEVGEPSVLVGRIPALDGGLQLDGSVAGTFSRLLIKSVIFT
jgi:hypothetical protein